MSSIAGPSSHAFSSFPITSRQPPAISTQLRRIQDVPDHALSGSSGAATPATPVMTTAPTTAPATPIARSMSTTTDARETSVDPVAAINGSVQNGMRGTHPPEQKPRDPKDAVVADLAKVKARTIALSKEHARMPDEEEAMVQTAARCVCARMINVCGGGAQTHT